MKTLRYIILNLKKVDKFSFPQKFQLEMKICLPYPPFQKYRKPNLGVIRYGKKDILE